MRPPRSVCEVQRDFLFEDPRSSRNLRNAPRAEAGVTLDLPSPRPPATGSQRQRVRPTHPRGHTMSQEEGAALPRTAPPTSPAPLPGGGEGRTASGSCARPGGDSGRSSAGARGRSPHTGTPSRGGRRVAQRIARRAGAGSPPRVGVGAQGGRGRGRPFRSCIYLNYSGERTHSLGTRIKSHSLYFN